MNSTKIRLLKVKKPDLLTYQQTFGTYNNDANKTLETELEKSGLTGRGGAGFPSWRKVKAVTGRKKVSIVANGAEGEPASAKDKLLLKQNPHLVLDGLKYLSTLLGAENVYLYLHKNTVSSMQEAIKENVDTSFTNTKIYLVEAVDSFVSGEASAALNYIEHGVALPKDRTKRLSEVGLKGNPTLLFNVETLANIALIAQHGAVWYREAGPAKDPGTRLLTLSGDVKKTEVVETTTDVSLREIFVNNGTDPNNLQTALIGGYHGVWVDANKFHHSITKMLDLFETKIGAGVVVAVNKSRCPLRVANSIVFYLAQQSTKQCGPCKYGLPKLAYYFDKLCNLDVSQTTIFELERLSGLVTARGICHHPDATSNFVLNTLQTFSKEVAAHKKKNCSNKGEKKYDRSV